eukprot:749826-Hanusia_phi.AAC.1
MRNSSSQLGGVSHRCFLAQSCFSRRSCAEAARSSGPSGPDPCWHEQQDRQSICPDLELRFELFEHYRVVLPGGRGTSFWLEEHFVGHFLPSPASVFTRAAPATLADHGDLSWELVLFRERPVGEDEGHSDRARASVVAITEDDLRARLYHLMSPWPFGYHHLSVVGISEIEGSSQTSFVDHSLTLRSFLQVLCMAQSNFPLPSPEQNEWNLEIEEAFLL